MIRRKTPKVINTIINGDCLEVLPLIPDKSVDLILTDLPYGVTAPQWDAVIPMPVLWKEYKRILKKDCVAVFTSVQPFTTMLISSNLSEFKYCWYWIKNQGTNFFHAKRMPIRKVEDIVVFGGKRYYPEITDGHIPTNSAKGCSNGQAYHGTNKRNYEGGKTTRFPVNILHYDCVDNYSRVHSSEKPVALFEYLIKTYTNKGDTVLDNCIGSGTTAIACINTKRNYIGIEKEEKYCKIAEERILKLNKGEDMQEARPHYETSEDRNRENDFAEKLCRIWDCEIEKLPEQYRLDYACVRGSDKQISAWLEIKCRNNASHAFGTYMLSLRKWMAGKSYFTETKKPFILAIRFNDRDMFLRYDESLDEKLKYLFQGRTVKKRDSQDEEPCVFIPMSLFEQVEE